jgi:hypothetical protein
MNRLYDSVKQWVRCDELAYSVGGLPVQKETKDTITTEEDRPHKKQKTEPATKETLQNEDAYDSDRSLDQEDMEMASKQSVQR